MRLRFAFFGALAAIGLQLAPTIASACTPKQMLFIGTVRNVNQTENQDGSVSCSYQVSVGQNWPSYLCPLTPGEGGGLTFVDATCALKNDAEISGVMRRSDTESSIE